MTLFGGIGVALVTLFDEDGRLLAGATAELAARLVERGVTAIVVCGTTGEAGSLAPDERAALIGAVRSAVPGPVPVLAGTGAATAKEAVALTRTAAEAGADAALALSPRSVEDPSEYYATLASVAGDLPLLAYHFPLASPPGVPLELVPELPVRGIKDSSGDADRLGFMLERFAGEVYVGSPTLLALAGPLGAAGAILGLANVVPERCAEAWAGDLEAQRALLADHLAASEDFPRALKERMAAELGTPAGVRSVLA
jgi:4-hydroxy-tetrahydrodipicolinate synthase